MRGTCLTLLLLRALAQQYIIVSQPRFSTISYKEATGAEFEPLIEHGLASPRGLHVDSLGRLFIADAELGKVLWYQLFAEPGKKLRAETGGVAMDVAARWVSTDGLGNIFASDESNSAIMKVTASDFAKGNSKATVLYSSKNHVSAPGGIAADNFFLYWANKAVGTTVGTLVKAPEDESFNLMNDPVHAIAKNLDTAHGICLTPTTVFFTAARRMVYGVKKEGSAIATITDKLDTPRACAFDGESTVYITDNKAMKVYQFATNMRILAPGRITLVGTLTDAYGVAVFTSKAYLQSAVWIWFILSFF